MKIKNFNHFCMGSKHLHLSATTFETIRFSAEWLAARVNFRQSKFFSLFKCAGVSLWWSKLGPDSLKNKVVWYQHESTVQIIFSKSVIMCALTDSLRAACINVAYKSLSICRRRHGLYMHINLLATESPNTAHLPIVSLCW